MKYRSKPVEIKVMLWDGNRVGPYGADAIVAWINANGGEARYEPPDYGDDCQHYPACIAIRTINGWAYAAPGDYVVRGNATFIGTNGPDPDGPAWRVRNFYPETDRTKLRRNNG